MTALMWTRLLLYFAVTAGVGGLVIALFRFRESRLVHNWACYYLVGQLVVLLVTLLTAFLPGCLLPLLLLSFVGLTLWRGFPRSAREAAIALLWVIGVLVVFPDLALLLQQVPLYEWDARSSWFFHGKAICLAGGIDWSFFTNPLYAWSLPDYPLLIPANAAASALFQGGWDDYSCKAFLLLNVAAYAYLFFLALGEKGYPWWIRGFVLIVLFDQETYSYVSGLADNHYIMPLLLVLFLLSLKSGSQHVPLAVVLMAYAANVKYEGKMYVVLILAGLLGVWLIRRWMNRSGRVGGWREHGPAMSMAVVIGVLPLLLWEILKRGQGLSNPVGIVQKLADVGRLSGLLSERTGTVTGYMLDYYDFKMAPCVLALVLILSLWRVLLYRRRPAEALTFQMHEGVTWLAFAACNGLIFFAYVVTPLDLRFHLGTSAGRLLFLPYMMLLLLALWSAESLYAHVMNRPSALRES